MIANYEYTDTFSGEANYSWVKRTNVLLADSKSDLAIVRHTKAWAGLSGCRAKVEKCGDMIEIRPQGMCTVLFITFN